MARETCTHCASSFTPTIAPDGAPEYTDAAGMVCCNQCLCTVCGHGHPTRGERKYCLAEFNEGGRDAVDPDAAYEAARDLLIGV
jgi:hypothetical protein